MPKLTGAEEQALFVREALRPANDPLKEPLSEYFRNQVEGTYTEEQATKARARLAELREADDA